MEDDWLVKHKHCGEPVNCNRNTAKKHVPVWKDLHRVAVSKKQQPQVGTVNNWPYVSTSLDSTNFRWKILGGKKFRKTPKAKLE